ncbi:RING-H2 finger protein ATL2-like [Zingiber officinale]|uniref:RING-type E3 ubiquitin transferase n=1 Tax=Zingiber officinale TaxID=94328 RepID=A0A8J5FWM5_ZINOF|nr:RING-H2 finger protein ATL2-like [Zingiber officinale]KAG6492141.1 hypothetical protein ZIOFF_047091 [Zingiber officinale]
MSNRDSSGGGWFVYDESSDSYDLNTRILATAVIFLAVVVLLVIVLHLYVRHVFFRRRRNNLEASAASGRRFLRFYVTDPAHDDHVAAPGLDPSAIAALLARPYRSTAGGDGECAICLSTVEDEEMVRVLPGCGHLFHVGCIDMWLGSHCTCPVCRVSVEPPSATAAAEDGCEATTPASQEEATLAAKESESASSFTRILSWERSTARRPQGQGIEDLERQ